MISGKYWPIHLKPQDDETISSWIARVATGHGLEIRTFCKLELPGAGLFKTDIDLSASKELARVLAEKTGTSLDRVLTTRVGEYEGKLYLKPTNGMTPKWILPIGTYTRGAGIRTVGSPFCVACLAEDARPYFRRAWRLAFNTLCPLHGRLLSECCSVCKQPIDLWKSAAPLAGGLGGFTVGRCPHCGAALGVRPTARHLSGGKSAAAQQRFQAFLNETVTRGWVSIPGYGATYSPLYFAGLHCMVDLFTQHPCSRRLRQVLAAQTEHTYLRTVIHRLDGAFENLSVRSRHALLRLLRGLLADWPRRYIAFCQENQVPASALYPDPKTVPYWYWYTTYLWLYRPARLTTSPRAANR